RLVGLAPPDQVAAARLVDDETRLGRAAGVPAGLDGEGAVLGDQTFVPSDRVLVQNGGSRVPVGLSLALKAQAVEPPRFGRFRRVVAHGAPGASVACKATRGWFCLHLNAPREPFTRWASPSRGNPPV